MMKIGFVFAVLQVASTLPNTSPKNEIVAENMKSHCERICKGIDGRPQFDDDNLICACHVGRYLDDLDEAPVLKQAKFAGVTMLILPKQQQKRELSGVKTSENSTIPIGVIIPKAASKDNVQKNPKAASENKIDQPKKIAEVPIEAPNQSTSSATTSDGAIVGAMAPTRKSTLSPRKTGVAPRQAVSAETTRSVLENAKKQLIGLIERTRLAGFNPSFIGAEIEAIRTSLGALSARHVERSSVDRSKLVEQIRAREKERQARLHSRFGHLEAKKKHGGHIVGAAKPNGELNVDEGKVITQPKELVEG